MGRAEFAMAWAGAGAGLGDDRCVDDLEMVLWQGHQVGRRWVILGMHVHRVQQQMGRVMQWLRLRVWVGALWGIGRTHAVNRAVQRMQGAIRGKWAQMQAGQLAKAVCDMQRQAQEMRQQLCEGGIKLVVLQQRMANGTVGAI